jgi:hypothetical protein
LLSFVVGFSHAAARIAARLIGNHALRDAPGCEHCGGAQTRDDDLAMQQAAAAAAKPAVDQ